jgi:hypothetical protein
VGTVRQRIPCRFVGGMQVPDPMDATIADYVHAATCIKAENDELIASVYHIPSLLTRKCWVAVNSTDGRFNFRLVEEVKKSPQD